MTTLNPQTLLNELAHFTGDLERYRSMSPKLIYTPGVQHLAEQAGAYWLIDAIAAYVPSKKLDKAIQKDERVGYLHFWKLEVSDDESATLTARVDRDEPPFITQEIPFTDFPLKAIELWCGFDGQRWTLYLPSEH